MRIDPGHVGRADADHRPIDPIRPQSIFRSSRDPSVIEIRRRSSADSVNLDPPPINRHCPS
jgi:hypothetical protein